MVALFAVFFTFTLTVKGILKDQVKYYEEIISYSKDKLMLYPYHLSDCVVRGLRITPFQYYCSIMEKIMDQEKSYDCLPNFTAADCKMANFRFFALTDFCVRVFCKHLGFRSSATRYWKKSVY